MNPKVIYPGKGLKSEKYVTTQAKCVNCHVRYIWPLSARVRVRDAYCPVCGDKLLPTTHLLTWMVTLIERPLSCRGAMRMRAVMGTRLNAKGVEYGQGEKQDHVSELRGGGGPDGEGRDRAGLL